MGPRLCSRGEIYLLAHALHVPPVAMGPRLCSRGELYGEYFEFDSQASQWGHGFVAVERLGEDARARRDAVSQWGHGFVAVERLPRPAGPRRSWRRNGATAL